MAQRGMEGVAINEITEAADVGFGSFYNHFESKEAIHSALMDQVFKGFADAIDQLGFDATDPAEIIAIGVRNTLLRAQRQPIWGQFLIREGLSVRVLEGGLGERLLRDILRGIGAKRFQLKDPMMSFISIGGTVLAAITAQLVFLSPTSAQSAQVKALGFNSDGLAERVASQVLKILGLDQKEADAIARRALPEVPADI